MDLRFILSRARNASFAEILYRMKEHILLARLGMSIKSGDWPLEVPGVNKPYLDALRLPTLDVHASAQCIEGLLKGEQWSLNTDIGSITRFEGRVRNHFFAHIRHEQDNPDIRAVWETARLQQVTTLLLYACRTPKSANSNTCQEAAKALLFDWIQKNPFLFGPHYRSVMECGLRIPVFFFALACLELDDAKIRNILTTIYHHAWWVEKRLSLYSSLGNHTICECLGLVFAGAVFGESGVGQHWLHQGIKLLGQELGHQVLPDGGPAEQSLSYQRFVLDLYWLVIDFLESNDLSDCTAWKSRLLRGEAFQAAFQDRTGLPSSIDDSDDGYAVSPVVPPRRGIPARDDDGCITFPDAGYTVIHLQGGTLFTFDHGPLGMAPLYNHGHADALSVTLSMNGVRVLADPGTYRYNVVPEWRKYFRGTRAHNTVTIDGHDQAVQETPFIWSHPYQASLVSRERLPSGLIRLRGTHDGYTRLPQPVRHDRTLLLDDRSLVVRDTFQGSGRHQFELNYHLHPEIALEDQGAWFRLHCADQTLFMCLWGNSRFSVIKGQVDPPWGWFSPAYGVKAETSVLTTCTSGFPEALAFTTIFGLGMPLSEDDIEERLALL